MQCQELYARNDNDDDDGSDTGIAVIMVGSAIYIRILHIGHPFLLDFCCETAGWLTQEYIRHHYKSNVTLQHNCVKLPRSLDSGRRHCLQLLTTVDLHLATNTLS